MIEICLWLYGNPRSDLDLDSDRIDPEKIKAYADLLKSHLYKISDIILKLQKNGWNLNSVYTTAYDLSFFNKRIKTIEQARLELIRLNIDIDKIAFLDFEGF